MLVVSWKCFSWKFTWVKGGRASSEARIHRRQPEEVDRRNLLVLSLGHLFGQAGGAGFGTSSRGRAARRGSVAIRGSCTTADSAGSSTNHFHGSDEASSNCRFRRATAEGGGRTEGILLLHGSEDEDHFYQRENEQH